MIDSLHRSKKAKSHAKAKELALKAFMAEKKYEKADKHYPKEHFAKKIK